MDEKVLYVMCFSYLRGLTLSIHCFLGGDYWSMFSVFFSRVHFDFTHFIFLSSFLPDQIELKKTATSFLRYIPRLQLEIWYVRGADSLP